MSSKTDYFEARLTDAIWRAESTLVVGSSKLAWVATATASLPPTFYVGLFSTMPTADGSTAGTESTGGSYARQPIVASLANMAAVSVSGGKGSATGIASIITSNEAITSNNNVITYTAMPDITTLTVKGFGIFDAITGGNCLEFATFGTPVSASAGATLTFAAGALTIQEDN